jgi:hypothetical protein
MHNFNMSFVFHFYILRLMSWIWTSHSTERPKFESLSEWNSYEGFNLEHCSSLTYGCPFCPTEFLIKQRYEFNQVFMQCVRLFICECISSMDVLSFPQRTSKTKEDIQPCYCVVWDMDKRGISYPNTYHWECGRNLPHIVGLSLIHSKLTFVESSHSHSPRTRC